ATRVGNSGSTGQCGNVVETYHLAQLNSGRVERMSESVCCCDVAFIAADEVLWCVGLASIVVGEGGLFIVELGKSGEDASIAERKAVDGAVVGRGVDERFEDGAGGALGDGVVELRDAIVAAPNQCEHLAGVGVDGNQRDLRIGDGPGFFALGGL